MLHATTQKMEDEEMEFDCWNYSVLEELQRKIKENQINFDILRNLARKPLTSNDPSKKNPFSFKKKGVLLGKSFDNYSDYRFKQTFCLSRLPMLKIKEKHHRACSNERNPLPVLTIYWMQEKKAYYILQKPWYKVSQTFATFLQQVCKNLPC